MPAKRTGKWTHEHLENEIIAEATIVDEEKSVYYTSESPQIEFVIRNNSDCTTNVFNVEWFVAVGDGRPEPLVTGKERLASLNPGEEHTFTISEELLIEGHCLIGVGSGLLSTNKNSSNITFNLTGVSPQSYVPLLSFPVWDSDHYEIIHGDTKRGQLVSILASVGIVSFAAYQAVQSLITSLTGPLAGSIAGFAVLLSILLIYLRTAYWGRLWASRHEYID